VTEHDGIRVTTVARTLLDVARTGPRRVLGRCVEGALIARVFDLLEVDAVLERHAGSAGTARLAAAVAVARDAPAPTRSELERLFLRLCADHGLPEPEVNVPIGAHVVDFLWRAERLVAETDGSATHLTPVAFETDRARDVELAVAGFRVVRFTYRQVTREPAAVARRIRALLDLGRPAAA
jgi:very-short-patch-repair endonuclease